MARRLLLGTRKGLLEVERGATGWKLVDQSHAGIPVPFALVDRRTGTRWASLDHGHWGAKLSRRKHGADWEEVEAPKYPDDALVYDVWQPDKQPRPATLEYIWVIQPGGDDEPGRLYLGTNPGGLFRSDDGGDSFELLRGLWDHESRPKHWMGGGKDTPGVHSVVVDPRDSTRVLIGISCAGVFESTDDGATWAPRNKGLGAGFLPDPSVDVGHDPHFLAPCSGSPDVLWQQNHVGVYVSRDGAASWEEVSEDEGPVGFGFPIAVHPTDPDTAWVVPAISDGRRMAIDGALVVCRTRDGGRTWEQLRRGLPQELAYDVVYRHALDLAGEDELAFGSTTGNVYWSGDGGDSWEKVGGNFPPVYSVRSA